MSDLKYKVLAHDVGNELASLSSRIQLFEMDDVIHADTASVLNQRVRDILTKFRVLINLKDDGSEVLVPIGVEMTDKEFVERIQLALDKCKQSSLQIALPLVTVDNPVASYSIICCDEIELIVDEVVRNAVKAGATRLVTHVSGKQGELVRVYFHDNGGGMTRHEKELMGIGGPRGESTMIHGGGGEGTRILKDLVWSAGGDIVWHSDTRGALIKLVFRKIGSTVKKRYQC